MERLQKVIAASGLTSRRKAEELITEGRVKVNGVTVTQLGTQVEKNDVITVDGKPLPHEELEYYLLNKPRKYVCTVNDEHGRNQVTDLIETEARIYPVGRLDYDSSGLLILTNDGEFANMLMHPRYHLPKTYRVTVKGLVTKSDIRAFQEGIILDDGVKTLPATAQVTNINTDTQRTTLNVTIYEGKNRQIRRMFEALGHKVLQLRRVQFGPLSLGELQRGQWRNLTADEIRKLKSIE